MEAGQDIQQEVEGAEPERQTLRRLDPEVGREKLLVSGWMVHGEGV